MGLEIVALVGVVGLLLIGAWMVWSVVAASRAETKARHDYDATVKKGALPPSLHPLIDLQKCIGTGACVESCPEKDVIQLLDGKAVLANPTVCIGHGECLRACPVDAIQLVLGSEKRGIDIPMVLADFQSNVPGLYIVGELGGMGLIYNAMTQAKQCVGSIVQQKVPKKEGVYQLLIVGAGPAGIAACMSAQAAGLDYVCVEQESIGGTVLHYPRGKLVMTRPVDLPLYGPLKVGEVKKEALLELWTDIVNKTKPNVKAGTRVEGITRQEGQPFEVKTPNEVLKAERIVLAMGRRGTPRKLGVPGEDLPKVIYRLIEAERYEGRHVLVVGGGDAAVEAAIALGDAHAKITLSHRGKTFDRIKTKNQEKLDKSVAAGKVTVLLETQAKELHADKVVLNVKGAEQTLPNDDCIVLIGGVLPTAFLEAAGVKVQKFTGQVFAPANQ